MTGKERVERTFRFEQLDRPTVDVMESIIWDSLYDYFNKKYGFTKLEEILSHLHCDTRWILAPVDKAWLADKYREDGEQIARDADALNENGTFSEWNAPLRGVDNVRDLERLYKPDAKLQYIPDMSEFAKLYPDKARVFAPLWVPYFSGLCGAFGFAEGCMKLHTEKDVVQAYMEIQANYMQEILDNSAKAGAAEHCDYLWLADDICGERGPLLDPQMWREQIKPYTQKAVDAVHKMGMKAIFHCCGSLRPFLGDFIDMGIDAVVVIQTSADNMVIEDLARDFGGKIVFWGGIDAQDILINGTPEDIKNEVLRNWRAFEKCGGYVMANSHHGTADIKGENMEMMCSAAYNIGK